MFLTFLALNICDKRISKYDIQRYLVNPYVLFRMIFIKGAQQVLMISLDGMRNPSMLPSTMNRMKNTKDFKVSITHGGT